MNKTSPKEIVLSFVKNLPDDISLHEIVHSLYVKEKILAGMADLVNNRIIPNNKMKDIIDSW